LNTLRDISDLAAEVGFRHRTFADPVLIDVIHALYGEDGLDRDPPRHLTIPLRMIAERHKDATEVKFSIFPCIREEVFDRIPVVASFRSNDECGGDHFVLAIDDTLLKHRSKYGYSCDTEDLSRAEQEFRVRERIENTLYLSHTFRP
jgi:hypothetical protein